MANDCALNTTPSQENSCFQNDQIQLISQYTDANTISEIKKETKCNGPDSDICILEKINIPTQIKSKLVREAFKAPTSSFDKDYWLNNTEIDTVMSQLRLLYPGFAHGFIHMIDIKSFTPSNIDSFDYKVYDVNETDFPSEFKCSLIKQNIIPSDGNVSKLSTYKNIPLHSYGIVCNTDSSSGSGQHWFAIFISTDKKNPENTKKPVISIELFNSSGGGCKNKEFENYWRLQAMNIARATGLRCTFDIVTNITHQGDTGNCGAYSLFYIYSRLNGVHPSEFNNSQKKITDYAMQKFRKVCFRIDENSMF